ILLYQNFTFNDLYTSFLYMIKLANSNSAKYFYFYNGFIPSPESVKNAVLSLTHIFSKFQPDSNRLQFSGYLLTILFGFFTIKLFLKRKNNNKKDILLYTLICSAFITSIKVAGSISLEIYGTYFIPVILSAFISFVTFSENKNKVKYCIIITFLCILTIYYTIADVKNIKKENLCTLYTAKGKINISSIYINETIELLEYINKNTKSSDKILIFPEGAIINYLSDRSSDDELYYLIPPNVEILGKENISKRILSEYPEYIIITNIMIYEDFAQGSFSKTWGKSITEKIKENYILEEVIGQDFKLNVYSHH
ncbi:MAG: hypothetical protein LUG16_02040, partial [Candidatus Gastranaerophilales bacterium]|nr:hypothetical protein [Candidatus Gastranaerophilales bacterium]